MKNSDTNSQLTSAAVDVETRPDGTMLLTCPYPPKPAAQSMLAILHERVIAFPDRVLLAERNGGQWCELSYAQAWAKVVRVAKALVDEGSGPDAGVAILCPKSFQHFQMAFGAQLAGIPVSPISTPYALLSEDHAKLKHAIGLIRPKVLLVEHFGTYAQALANLGASGLLDGIT